MILKNVKVTSVTGLKSLPDWRQDNLKWDTFAIKDVTGMMGAKGKQGSLCYFCNSSVSLTVSKFLKKF